MGMDVLRAGKGLAKVAKAGKGVGASAAPPATAPTPAGPTPAKATAAPAPMAGGLVGQVIATHGPLGGGTAAANAPAGRYEAQAAALKPKAATPAPGPAKAGAVPPVGVGMTGPQAVANAIASPAAPSTFVGAPTPKSANPAAAKNRPAEAVFQRAKAEGRSEAGAFFTALVEEPGDVTRMFGEAFVEDELRSFVKGMDLGNQVASLSPDPTVQKITTFVTKPIANLVDITAGLIVHDDERVKAGLVDTVVETSTDLATGRITDGLHIKTSDARVSPFLMNRSGAVSDAALTAAMNNVIAGETAQKITDFVKLKIAEATKK